MGTDVIKNITIACEKLGDVELAGIKLESGDVSLLDVTKFSIDQHVAMQPAAIAYYGTLKKRAAQNLAILERAFDRWTKRKFAEARASVEAGTANKVNVKVEDIKSRHNTDNETKIDEWEAKIDKAQADYDTLDSWFDAWKQKSFSIRETVSIEEDERFTGTSIMGKKDREDITERSSVKVDKIREIIKRRGGVGQ